MHQKIKSDSERLVSSSRPCTSFTAAIRTKPFRIRVVTQLLCILNTRPPALYAQGVFFVLATKAISVPALCGSGRLCERRIHALDTDDYNSDDSGQHDDLEGGGSKTKRGSLEGVEEEEDLQRAPLGGGKGNGVGSSSRPTIPQGREKGNDGVSVNRTTGNPNSKAELDLPPRHWMCIVCKKVRRFSPSFLRASFSRL